jgi:probable F420-dependent oxidoreductase
MYFTITHPMHSHPYNPELVTGAGIATVAAAAEAAGFHGFGFTDHPAPTQRWLESGGHDAVDPFVAMAFAAARTTTLRLIPNIVVLPYRNPFVVAKAGATLDLLSDGRFTLAVGVGYLKREFAALGVDFEERAALFEEALEVIRAIWTTDDLSFEGRHFSARGITAHPRPASKPHPPIWIGGNTAAARQRVVKHGDGWCPFPAPAVLAQTARTAAMDSVETLAQGIDDLRRQCTMPRLLLRTAFDVCRSTGTSGSAKSTLSAMISSSSVGRGPSDGGVGCCGNSPGRAIWAERTVPVPTTTSSWVTSHRPSDVAPFAPKGRAVATTGTSGSCAMIDKASGLSSRDSSVIRLVPGDNG